MQSRRALKTKGRAAGLVLAASVALPASGHAATHVLSVGIDQYAYEQELSGAVADATDIANATKAAGGDVVLLTNGDATRVQVEREWRAMIGRASPGDTVIFSYAGHGGQEPDKAPMDEADGLDEAFLLAGFNPDPRHAGYGERILDDTLHEWLNEAGDRGLKVIFVADACHSGTMTRSADSRMPIGVRARPPYGIPAATPLHVLKEQAAGLPASATALEDDLRHVTFLSATQEDRKAPEVMIDGHKRGALSYAFARAVEGAGDANNDGVLSRFELEGYIARQVRQISEAQQTADLKPRGGQDASLLRVVASPLASASLTTAPPLKLSILGLDPTSAQTMEGRLAGVTVVPAGAAADLVWDASRGDVISAVGDPVAHDITDRALAGVTDKWRAIADLKRLVANRSVEVRIAPDDGKHAEGERVAIYTAPLTQPYVTVINLAPDGTLNLLYPVPTDPATWPAGQPYRVDPIEVRAPFGADHVLLIASDRPLPGLHSGLKSLPVGALATRLMSELSGAEFRLGLAGLYTTRSKSE